MAAGCGTLRTRALDVGGINSVTDNRDGTLVYYDINALSNSVADAPRVADFDPFAKLADYLEGLYPRVF